MHQGNRIKTAGLHSVQNFTAEGTLFEYITRRTISNSATNVERNLP